MLISLSDKAVKPNECLKLCLHYSSLFTSPLCFIALLPEFRIGSLVVRWCCAAQQWDEEKQEDDICMDNGCVCPARSYGVDIQSLWTGLRDLGLPKEA